MTLSNAELIAELNRRAEFPEDVPDRAFLVGIRYLLSQAATSIEELEAENQRIFKLSENLYRAMHSVAPMAADLIADGEFTR